MTFYQNLELTKVFVFHQTEGSLLISWIHNDSMYVGFGGMRNIKTWNKSVQCTPMDNLCKFVL